MRAGRLTGGRGKSWYAEEWEHFGAPEEVDSWLVTEQGTRASWEIVSFLMY